MGTRAAYGFRINNEDKLTYNHWDGYPSYLGGELTKQFANFINSPKTRLVKRDADGVYIDGDLLCASQLDVARKNVEALQLVSDDVPPTEEQKKQLEAYTNLEVNERTDDTWYCLLRESQGSISDILNGKLLYMENGNDFIVDSLFCEWAYIFNFDTQRLEMYKGFNKASDPRLHGRYANIKEEDRTEYLGCSLFLEIDFSVLTKLSDGQLEEVMGIIESDLYADEPKYFNGEPVMVTEKHDLVEFYLVAC